MLLTVQNKKHAQHHCSGNVVGIYCCTYEAALIILDQFIILEIKLLCDKRSFCTPVNDNGWRQTLQIR